MSNNTARAKKPKHPSAASSVPVPAPAPAPTQHQQQHKAHSKPKTHTNADPKRTNTNPNPNTNTHASASAERERERERTRLKSIVRRLPPNLPEDVFWGSVAPWVTRESAVWRVFCPGRLRRRAGKESVLSRAYIAFRTEDELVHFAREFDGHLFRDKNGNEYQAVVEYAPYQKVPSDKKKADARSNTIDKDEDYISFIASLKAAETAEPPSLDALLATAQPQATPKTTPLLEALKAEKSAHKDKEAILRSHGHYKDKEPTILAPPPREAKKKGPKAQAPSAPAQAEGSSAAKKGKKVAQTQTQPQVKGGQKAVKPPRAKPVKTPAAAVAIAQPQPQQQQQQQPQQDVTPAQPKRTRPVIGLGSRQFEAAMSGVGGGTRVRREQGQGGSGPPSPRRARKKGPSVD